MENNNGQLRKFSLKKFKKRIIGSKSTLVWAIITAIIMVFPLVIGAVNLKASLRIEPAQINKKTNVGDYCEVRVFMMFDNYAEDSNGKYYSIVSDEYGNIVCVEVNKRNYEKKYGEIIEYTFDTDSSAVSPGAITLKGELAEMGPDLRQLTDEYLNTANFDEYGYSMLTKKNTYLAVGANPYTGTYMLPFMIALALLLIFTGLLVTYIRNSSYGKKTVKKLISSGELEEARVDYVINCLSQGKSNKYALGQKYIFAFVPKKIFKYEEIASMRVGYQATNGYITQRYLSIIDNTGISTHLLSEPFSKMPKQSTVDEAIAFIQSKNPNVILYA